MEINREMNESPSSPLIQNIAGILQNADSILQQLETKPTYTVSINANSIVTRCPPFPIDFSEHIRDGKITVSKVTDIPIMDIDEKMDKQWSIHLEDINKCGANEGIFIKNNTSQKLELTFTPDSIFTTQHKDNLIIGIKKDMLSTDLDLPPNTVVGILNNGQIFLYYPPNWCYLDHDRAYILIQVTNDKMEQIKHEANEENQ